jgi:hypothetical protein
MRTATALITLVACTLLLALPASPAWANSTDDRIISDCQNSPTGTLRGNYPLKQLNHALHSIGGDQAEYSGCYDAIKQAKLAALNRIGDGDGTGSGGTGGGGIGSGGGGTAGGASGGTAGGASGATGEIPSAPPPPGADRPLDVAGTSVAPGALPEIGRDAHRLPTPLLVLLVLLGLAALAPAARTIGSRVLRHRGA